MEIIREVRASNADRPILCHMCKCDIRKKSKAFWIRVPMAKTIVCVDCLC